MGSSPEFHEIFAAEPGASTGVSFARFMELALYHPQCGYYVRRHRRIGLDPETDFHTATSLGPLFGELVAAAAVNLLGPREPREFVFVEIGAETADRDGPGVLAGLASPFGGAQTIPLGQPITLPARCVVFSNELFDAQPCHRLVRRNGQWRELGVAWRDGALIEVEVPSLSAEVGAVAPRLPSDSPEGYHLDLPLRSVGLLRQITAQPWRGLFLAFDYGKSWSELAGHTPQGTVRAYSRHRQTGDLLARPGQQDLTCHVCWDWLADTLAGSGFSAPSIEPQEAFFARRAAPVLEATVANEATRFSARKQALMHLLHPAHMGQKFQVLHALRE
jgi:SAM-dependent MidA family methyltransferase